VRQLDEKLKNRLKILFATVDSWSIYEEYLKYLELNILTTNLNAVEDKELRINQGKLQLIHSMKSLRDTLRDL